MENKEYELQTRFINENMDVLQKYLIWKEFISEEPQVLSADVTTEAVDVEYYESTLTQEQLNELFGNSNTNYGVIEQNPNDPTRV